MLSHPLRRRYQALYGKKIASDYNGEYIVIMEGLGLIHPSPV
jgi:hypothetical protein